MREQNEMGRVIVRTSNKWNYTATLGEHTGIRLKQIHSEKGTALLRSLSFEHSGSFSLYEGGREWESIQELHDVCAIRRNPLVSESEGSRRSTVPSYTQRRLAAKYAPGAFDITFFHNPMEEGPETLTKVQFRCLMYIIYDNLVRTNEYFRDLVDAVQRGFSFVIWTDSPVFHNTTLEDLSRAFSNPGAPPSAEEALASLLLFEDPNEYPWNVYRRNNEEIFV